jgi:hypothetical protein
MLPRIVLTMMAAMLLLGCADRNRPPAPVQGMDSFGHLGEASGSSGGKTDYRFRYPYLMENGCLAVAGFSQYGERAMSPSFLVIVRLPSVDSFYRSFNSSSSGDGHTWRLGLIEGGGEASTIRHTVENELQDERFFLGGKEYALEDGRVFTFDLTTEPPQATQTDADLGKLLPDPDPTQEQFRAALQNVRADHKAVEELMEKRVKD